MSRKDYEVLYDNTAGTTSNITVSKAFSDFQRIGIYYFVNIMAFQGYQEIAHTSGPQDGCVLSVSYPDESTTTPTVYIRSTWITLINKTITFERNMSYKSSTTGTVFTDDKRKVSIYKVIGFKY